MTPPQNPYQIAGLFIGYAGRFFLLIGAAMLLASFFLHTGLWPLGVLFLVVALFLMAIGYALNLPA